MTDQVERRLREALPRLAGQAPAGPAGPDRAARRAVVVRHRAARWAALTVPVAAAALVAGTVWAAQPDRRPAVPPAVSRTAVPGPCPAGWQRTGSTAQYDSWGPRLGHPTPELAARAVFEREHPGVGAAVEAGSWSPTSFRFLVEGKLVMEIKVEDGPGPAGSQGGHWLAALAHTSCRTTGKPSRSAGNS